MDDQGAKATLRQGVRDDDDAVPKPLEDIVAAVSLWCNRAGGRARGRPQVEGENGAQVVGRNGALEDVVMKMERVSKNLRELVTARKDEG